VRNVVTDRQLSLEARLESLGAEVARLGAAQERLALAQRRARGALAGALALAGGALFLLFAGAAESRTAGLKLAAPFRITGRGGVTLFRVSQNGVVEIHDPSGRPLARSVDQSQGRGLQVLDESGAVVGLLGAGSLPGGSFRGLQTFDAGGVLTALLGEQPASGHANRGVFAHRPDGALGGMLGHDPVFDASGVVVPGADGQSPVIILAADFGNNRAGLQITNLQLKDEVHLVASEASGILQLFDSSGNLFFSQPPAP
jgi:hypothetical protein